MQSSSRSQRSSGPPSNPGASQSGNYPAHPPASSRSLGGGASSSGVHHGPRIESRRDLMLIALGALGVVYGDIGTSPLYSLKECFAGEHGMAVTPENVYGILSLVFWALTLVVVFKYIAFILRADNHGEGGILSLLALIVPRGTVGKKATGRYVLILLGLFGAALLYGDGVITPVISVFGAVEGLQARSPALGPYVMPISAVILVGLFLVQKRGTAKVGALFGPVMVVWFLSITLIGLPWVIRNPYILGAINPLHAVHFFVEHKGHGFLALGAVVLCVTGGEALYADMGHFGTRAIRLAWYSVVFPSLLVSYFGQGAWLLAHGQDKQFYMIENGVSVINPVTFNPFYLVIPGWAQLPMVLVATAAAIVASQALISGAFSLTRQAVQLGYWPRVQIVHTSGEAEGQIYVPEINAMLMVGCLALVVAFRREGSSGLAAAYGIAVTGTMSITSILFAVVARERWNWPIGKIVAIVGAFMIIDLSFLGANVAKIAAGGWIPVAIAIGLFTMMTTWKSGRYALEQFVQSASLPMDLFMGDLERRKPHRVKGTAVFMTGNPEGAPVILLHHFKHNKVLHEQVVLLSIVTDRIPEVAPSKRISVRELGQGFYQVMAHYGFMQSPNVLEILRRCRESGLITAENDTSYFLGRETLLTTGKSGLARWRKALFAFLARNARSATSFFGIPPNRVVEMGAQIEL